MPQELNSETEAWETSPVIRSVGHEYEQWAADRYSDAPARLTPRQVAFYRNLIEMALAGGSSDFPVDFVCNGVHVYLDHGCIKIAEHAGFIEPLSNGPNGVVETIKLSWSVGPPVATSYS
jgi:hypothetical protein